MTTLGDRSDAVPPSRPLAVSAVPDIPARASGLQLIGEMSGSGYREPPALVRRSDGQMIQLSSLLYLVLTFVDGHRTHAQIAAAVTPASGRAVSAENVETLCARLRTLGVLKRADGSEPDVRRSNPLLALRFRYAVTDPEVTNRLTAPFAKLFNPVSVVVVCLTFLAVCGWVLLEKGLASATHQAFDQPGLLLAVFAVTILSAGFHEFGHAAAARYGGATPGVMGTGLYLVWPAFYTDVTDSYRLGRAGRVRTDLGGLYFNALVTIATYAAYMVSGWHALLLIVATQVLQMLRQLTPIVRCDGYHVLADLTGVPDLYHRIKPTLLGLLPGRWRSPEATVLKPWARAVVSAWVLVVVPVLLGVLVLMALGLPRLVGTALTSLQRQAGFLADSFGDGAVLGIIVRVLAIFAIALPVLGSALILGRAARQAFVSVWRTTQGRPIRRAGAAAAALGLIACLTWAWWPDAHRYRPVQAYERGAVQDLLPTAFRDDAPAQLQAGQQRTARTIWPEGASLPTAEAPVLAVILVPHGGSPAGGSATDASPAETVGQPAPAPTWVFPFDRPLPAGEGDNQALAVNTTDGSILYDVAFAIVWADSDAVLNANEAYALASCTECQTVAVAFQVVVVIGQADVVVPQNLAAAVNYGCVQCVTVAIAQQLVLSVPTALDDASMARLEVLWREIAAFGASLEGLPLSEIEARLDAFEAALIDILRPDSRTSPAPSPSTTAPSSGSGPPSPATPGVSRPGPTASSQSADDAARTPSPTTDTVAEPSATPRQTPAGTSTPTQSSEPAPDPTSEATKEPAESSRG